MRNIAGPPRVEMMEEAAAAAAAGVVAEESAVWVHHDAPLAAAAENGHDVKMRMAWHPGPPAAAAADG